MFRMRYIILSVVLTCGGCASAPNGKSKDEFTVTVGIVNSREDTPKVLEIVTNVIPLNGDGTMPWMAVQVKRSKHKDFLLSYRVYRRVEGSDAYSLTETSPIWRIHADSGSGGIIRPDFLDGVYVGEYRFAIFIDKRLWRAVEFKVVPHGT